MPSGAAQLIYCESINIELLINIPPNRDNTGQCANQSQ